MNIALLLLAAGSSQRMGAAKQLLTVGNTTLLGHAIDMALQSNVNQIYCVIGAHAKKIKTSIEDQPIEIIVNPNFANGLSSSIITGLTHITSSPLSFDAILIMLADQPLINDSYLNKLIEGYIKNPTKIIASDYGHNTGVPAIFPRTFFDQLLKLEGDVGAQSILNNNREAIIKMECKSLLDIDTKEDYLNFLKSL